MTDTKELEARKKQLMILIRNSQVVDNKVLIEFQSVCRELQKRKDLSTTKEKA